jgi:hypothetical protein
MKNKWLKKIYGGPPSKHTRWILPPEKSQREKKKESSERESRQHVVKETNRKADSCGAIWIGTFDSLFDSLPPKKNKNKNKPNKPNLNPFAV